MGWSISQILKPFKKLAVVHYKVFKPDNTRLGVFKQYVNLTGTVSRKKRGPLEVDGEGLRPTTDI